MPPVSIDDARAARRRRRRDGGVARRSEALLARGAVRRDRRARSVDTTPGCARRAAGRRASSAAAAAASTSARSSTRTSSRPAAGTSRRTRSRVGICGMVSSEISISLGLRGISHVLSCGCTSSTDAIGYAASLIRSGEYDVLLSGGTDGCVLPGMIFGFSRMRAVSTHYNDRPATGVASVRSRARRVRARRRRVDAGARARGPRAGARRARLRLASTATRRPATPITACRWIRTAREIVRCMTDGARPRRDGAVEEIGYVNYHGTSTQLNDAIESRCVRRVFGAPRRPRAGIVDQVDDRPSAGRERRRRRRGHGAGAVARVPAADDQSDDPDPRATWTSSPTTGAPRGPRRRSATASGSDRRTAPWSWARSDGRPSRRQERAAGRTGGRHMDEVIIAGAGPAGAWRPRAWRALGCAVRLFDRARFPRPKLCGDTLNPGALRLLGAHIALDRLLTGSIGLDGMLLTGPGGVAVRGRYPGGLQGRALSRAALDARLVEHAVEAGAQFDDGVAVVSVRPACGGREMAGVTVRSAAGAVHEHRLPPGDRRRWTSVTARARVRPGASPRPAAPVGDRRLLRGRRRI